MCKRPKSARGKNAEKANLQEAKMRKRRKSEQKPIKPSPDAAQAHGQLAVSDEKNDKKNQKTRSLGREKVYFVVARPGKCADLRLKVAQ